MAEITLDMLQASKVRETMHFDGPRGPKGFFGYFYQGIEFPRLQRKVTYWRGTKGTTIEWYVDGVRVGDTLADAVVPLNHPVSLTEDETAALAAFDDDWKSWKDASVSYEVLRALQDKGAVEAQRGMVRRRQEAT